MRRHIMGHQQRLCLPNVTGTMRQLSFPKGSLRGALRDQPIGEDRSTGGSGMQEENGTDRTTPDFTPEDAENAEEKRQGNGDWLRGRLRRQAPWKGVSACVHGGYNRVWHFGCQAGKGRWGLA